MQQVVQKESYVALQTIYVKEKANTCVNYCTIKCMKTFLLAAFSFTLTCLIAFLFCLYFYILTHFKIVGCIVKSLITTSKCFFVEILMKKENLKYFLGATV